MSEAVLVQTSGSGHRIIEAVNASSTHRLLLKIREMKSPEPIITSNRKSKFVFFSKKSFVFMGNIITQEIVLPLYSVL